jgi:MscS family membrane protein
MKVKFETVFKFYVVLLLALLLWSVYAIAAENSATTNATNTITSSNSVAATNVSRTFLFTSKDAALDFGLREVESLQVEILGVQAWQYLASLIYIALAFLVARILDWFIRSKLRKWAERTHTKLDDFFINIMAGPIKLIVFVVLLHIGLQLFPWPSAAEHYVSRGLQLLVAVSLIYVALKIVDALLDYWRERAHAAGDRALAANLLPFISNVAKIFIVIVGVLMTFENFGFQTRSLLASLSVGGLAVGLAAQDTLANLFGAVAVFVDKPFRVGDVVKIDATEGVVEVIGMRSTRVRTADGHLVAIPNKTVGNATIVNIAKRAGIRTVMNIGLTYDTTADRVKRAVEILEGIYKAHEMTKDVIITFNKFADSALNIEVVHVWNSTDYKAYLKGLQELNLNVKQRFDAEGLEFAFPTRTVFVKQVDAA